jgi:DNA (cytosine-5)-methyltransferase 1
MKQIHIKLSDQLHHDLRLECAKLDTCIQDYVSELLFKNLKNSNTKDLLSEEKCQFNFIDLFSGVGGIRLPFQELGGKCVFSSEIDKFAKQTYQAFYGDLPEGDITLIDPLTIPDFNILLAGFPCQPFSQAGQRKGFDDTRGTMFFYIEEILRIKKPQAFLLENVKGLKGHDKGNTFKVICNHLENLGYKLNYQVLAAKDFGLPQNRERIYIVGFLNHEHAEKFNFPTPLNIPTRVGDILENNVAHKYTISDKLWQGHQRRKLEHKTKGNGFGYSMFNNESQYTNTISARYNKDGSEILIDQGEGKNPRKITPLEAARLQGFPDELVIKAREAGVSDAQLYKQFGNSVAVNVIREIAKKMHEAMTMN